VSDADLIWTARLERHPVIEAQGGYMVGDLVVEVNLGEHATLYSACIHAIKAWQAAPRQPAEVGHAVLIATGGDLEARLMMEWLVGPNHRPSSWRTRWSFRIV
jgi:hypothetical protein